MEATRKEAHQAFDCLVRQFGAKHPKAVENLVNEYIYLNRGSEMATSIRLTPEIEQRLDYLASHTGRTKERRTCPFCEFPAVPRG